MHVDPASPGILRARSDLGLCVMCDEENKRKTKNMNREPDSQASV